MIASEQPHPARRLLSTCSRNIDGVLAKRRLTARAHLVFWVFFTAFAGFLWIGGLGFAIGDLLGGTTEATVIHVYTQEAYTIRFTTTTGIQCVTPHKWDPGASPVKLGDTFKVHYSRISPCDNVSRANDLFSRYGFAVIPTVFLAIGYVNLRRSLEQRRAAAS